ncbi:hypothetical protein FWC63_01810 [Candidatus Saccharibacteria bacterium]|nr:hypothetical protein [Candidatus Saccharibacteria bacterium]
MGGILLVLAILTFAALLVHRMHIRDPQPAWAMLNSEGSSLDDIRELMTYATTIYVCPGGGARDSVCRRPSSIVTNEQAVSDFLDIATSLTDRSHYVHTFDGSAYTLYLVSSDRKIIAAVDFSRHFVIMTSHRMAWLDTSRNDELMEILGLR